MGFEKIGKLTGYEPKKISEFLWTLDNFQKSGFCSPKLSEIITFVTIALSKAEVVLPLELKKPPQSQPGTPTDKCRSCGTPVEWKKTLAGRWCPFDLDGQSHFKTCPQASRWSGGGRQGVVK